MPALRRTSSRSPGSSANSAGASGTRSSSTARCDAPVQTIPTPRSRNADTFRVTGRPFPGLAQREHLFEPANSREAAVSDSISTLAREKAEQVAETAQEALGVIAQKVHPAPPKKHRIWPWFVLGLFAMGAIAVWWSQHSEKQFDSDYGAAPDAFGDAVMEERAAYENGRMPAGTPVG